MPFREKSRLESRIEMVRMHGAGLVSVTDITALYGVSRETVYYGLGARRQAGSDGSRN